MSQVKGLCVMDVDGTLILEEVIDLLGKEAGREEEISQITSRAMQGELDFESSLRKRVSLLEGLPVSVFDKVFNTIHLTSNAQEFISILQNNGILVGLVSGGFTPIVERLAKSLDIAYFSANQLEVKDGLLTGKLVGQIISPEVKKDTLEQWRKELKLSKETLSRQSLLTHDRKRSLAYNEDEQYKSVVSNRAFPSLLKNWMNKSHEITRICLEHENKITSSLLFYCSNS